MLVIEGLVRKVFVPTHAIVSMAKLSKSWYALNNTRSIKGTGYVSSLDQAPVLAGKI